MKIFVARDHNYANRLFGEIKENAKIKVSIIGKRFELNDPYIVAIASLVDKDRAKAKIRVLDDKPVPLEEPESEDESEEEEPEESAPISIPTALPKKAEQEEGELEEGEERE
jgi:CTP synthase (UTP-ammonia lyase)